MTEYPILDVQDLQINHGESTVLRNVSFSVRGGDVLTFVGPSGGGKTSLVKCLNLLLFPVAGKISFDGVPIYEARSEINNSWVRLLARRLFGVTSSSQHQLSIPVHLYRQRFGMVFQEYNLWPYETIYNNIAAPLKWRSISERIIREQVAAVAEVVGIAPLLDKYPGQVSGGEKQRTAIARALITKPMIMIFDEVTSALDPDRVLGILRLIEQLASSGATMILVTHHVRFAARVSTHIGYVGNGKLKGPLPTDDFFASSDPEVRAFLSRYSDLEVRG